MRKGRPRLPGTDAHRAEQRRQQVRENVRAFRERNRQRAISDNQIGSPNTIADDQLRHASSSRSEHSPAQALSEQPRTRRVSVTSLSVGNDIRWSLKLPFRIGLGPSYSYAFIAAFNDRSLPNQDPGTPGGSLEDSGAEGSVSSHPKTPPNVKTESPTPSPDEYLRVEIYYNSWTTTISIASMSTGAEMLKQALLATALGLISLERNDPRIAAQAIQIQTTALRLLREAFDRYVENQDSQDPTLLSATALALSMSDLLVHKSWPGFALHLKGVGALIEHAGPAALNTCTARDNFLGYRAAHFWFGFLERKGSFLARPEWIDLDWREGHKRFSHPAHTLLDIAYQIPVQMDLFDKTPDRDAAASRRQLQKLNELAMLMDDWENDLFAERPPAIDNTEAVNWQALHNNAIQFPDAIVAASFTLFCGVKVSMFSLVRQLAEDLKKVDESASATLENTIQESYKWSKTACQCLEYFFSRDQNVVGRIFCLFPFDAAWSTFSQLSTTYDMDMANELQWCKETSERIQAAGLPVFAIRHHD